LAKAAEAKQMSAIAIVFLTIMGDFLCGDPIETGNFESADSKLCADYLTLLSFRYIDARIDSKTPNRD
jgi:hypothetical protein